MRFTARRYREFLGLAAAVLCLGAAVAVSRAAPGPGPAVPAPAPPRHWSFQPVGRPQPPAVKDEKWVRSPVDRFVLARQESEGLKPAAEADRQTLIRRLTFDLTGLPPTPDEIRAFEKDKSPDAYEKLVDRLLASPHYGEHWGRHWLDVARYVPGRISFPGIRNTKGDAAYRDYVVRAFNGDKPYDRFVTEQLAGDLLPPSPDGRQEMDRITAPAFLSIGGWFDQETDPNRLRLEMVDDMVNTTSQGFLGLTVSCARCHDHKFDPIPTGDYYALGGVFRSTKLVGELSPFWRDGRTRQLRPLAMPDEVAANERLEKQIAANQAQRWEYLKQRHAERMTQWQADEAKYRAAAAKLPQPYVKLIEAENYSGQDNLRIAQLMRDGVSVDVIETQTPTAPWVRYEFEVPQTAQYRLDAFYSSGEGTPLAVQINGKTVVEDALGESTGGWDLGHQRWRTAATFELRQGLNYLRLLAKDGSFPRLDRLRLSVVAPEQEARVRHAATESNLHPLLLSDFLLDGASPWPTVAGIEPFLTGDEQANCERIKAEIATLESRIKNYELTVAVTDEPQPADLPVHVGGDTYRTAGAEIPRGPLHLFDDVMPRRPISAGSSGRLELAKWITDPRNPLTARVMVNRIWQGHFGRGIVATPSDFGKMGAAPTHPELLDWLASEFMDSGWSIKHMHRLIVLSATYRQSAFRNPQSAVDKDPDDKLLSRFPRRRLEAEAIYDAMRSTTNMIPRQPAGQPLDVDKSGHRAMYLLANGRSPKGLGVEVRKMFPLFDYEMAPTPLAARPTSATAAQSLFFMNNPLPRYLAERFAERLLKMDKLSDEKRLEMAYLLALGRPPGETMQKQAMAFLERCAKDEGLSGQEAWTKFCQALYATAEFRYVD